MQSRSYQIKKVSTDELEELRRLSVETFSDTFTEQNNEIQMKAYLEKAFNTDQLRSELSNPESFFYFVKEEDKILGYLKLNTKTAQTDQVLDSSLEIERIYLTEEAQGKGIGKLLMDFSIAEAKRRNLLCLWLGVWEKNEKAIAFYKSYGFEVFADHPFKLGDDSQKDLLMKRFV
ncbi:MAG: GNAT family N-acetyltransferase [Roseivirga sp.]|uniref:GNAT family N-acetyltransferase n=1 Tax=Roseivirga sp. TaxID=1964215 RepID=UPI001B1BF0B8|nr:GNAT family N-acetyltransferase [Roseivirga sp.]MBO6659114.1 GNAT family N-acetyltransferase [Roseivirga sp.]MBO6762616.1 GNAT family N-acetyltransferase [Roseivirga sp.]MBO6908149.1 GNAT family N-acetyltransferase [Roseivirga sp.]